MTKGQHGAVLLLGLGLIGLGVGAVVLPEASSHGYGVPTQESTWVTAAGLRDVSLGLMALVFRARYPDVLRFFVPLMFPIPVGDVVLVLAAGQPLFSILPHAVGTVGIAVLSVWLWRRPVDGVGMEPG
jgi:hypothetical protein